MESFKKTLEGIIVNSSAALIGSVDEAGFPNVKAMLPPRKRSGLRLFYFTTNASSVRVKQYKANPRACVYFYDKRFYKGVMFKGEMSVLTDKKTKKSIWRSGDELYYPAGVSDPDYCVLKFAARSGRFYSNFRSRDFQVK